MHIHGIFQGEHYPEDGLFAAGRREPRERIERIFFDMLTTTETYTPQKLHAYIRIDAVSDLLVEHTQISNCI